MTITIIQGAFLPVPPILGGAVEKIWFRLGREFANHENNVIHISKKSENFADNDIQEGVNYIRVKGYKTPSNLFILKILDLFYTLRAIQKIPKNSDIIISNTFWTPILLFRKNNVVISVERMPRWQFKLYFNAFKFRANSTIVANELKKLINKRFHNKIITIPNPLPFDSISNVPLESKSNVILYVGRLHPEKGIDILINAFRAMNKKGYILKIIGPWQVAFGGGGNEYFNRLKDLANQTKDIQFLGPIFDEKLLNTYYQEAEIFAYPSIAEKGETFGLAPLEAMAWGCVPVVSKLACFSDFITHSKNGLVFDHNDIERVEQLKVLIETLIENKTLRMKLAYEAVKVNQTHAISTIVDLFLNEFKSKND